MNATETPAAATMAVVLAAGRGTRMQRPHEGTQLDDGQRRAADAGVKVMMPFGGHPYLSYVLTALADGGVTDVCIVVATDDDAIRAYYEGLAAERLRLRFGQQPRPLGSADALLSAEAAVGEEPFVVVNGDNLYPAPVIERVRRLPDSGLAGFGQDTLRRGGIPAERMAAFALIEVGRDGCLARIVEKPGAEAVRAAGPAALVSMTCWRFDARIFDACRAVGPSARGEYELPDAVNVAVQRGVCFRVLPVNAAVLDLTSREDVPGVATRLRSVRVAL